MAEDVILTRDIIPEETKTKVVTLEDPETIDKEYNFQSNFDTLSEQKK